jgi:hypothetical protein
MYNLQKSVGGEFMGRHLDPLTQYRVRPHVTNGYVYASTQTSFIDQATGVKKYRHVHWGTIDEGLRFIPGNTFWLASPDERALLIFPDDWDLTAANTFTGLRHPGRPAYEGEPQNRLYGDIWLLEQIAKKTGIRSDLEVVFNRNFELVDDLLTLAMFPYLTGFTFNRVARWQRLVRTPSSRELTPSIITRLTQSITERDRVELLKLRSARIGKDELCAIDSATRSAYGESLTDIRWGKNKDGLSLPQTHEAVVYSLTSHMPVYYRTFPGNIPDSRTLDVILADLGHAGFKNPVLITDRGYETIRDMEKYILRGQPMIMCAKTTNKEVQKAIKELGEFRDKPEAMDVDADAGVYYSQSDFEYTLKGTGTSLKTADRLRINLYFNPVRRSNELLQMHIAHKGQEAVLRELLEGEVALEDFNAVKRENGYYKINYDPATGVIKGFKLNEGKVERETMLSGFFSIISHKLDYDAMRTYHAYRLRDEQEKCFEQMKSQMVSSRQRNWSEEGKTGRLLILFVSLVLGSQVRHVWNSTDLKKLFSSSMEVLDEMRSIRCIEHPNRAKVITPFVGAQVAICEAFGFPIPTGCAPAYISRQQPKKRRGRPPKRKVELDS